MKKNILDLIFKTAVDGREANAYHSVLHNLGAFITTYGDQKIKLSTLYDVLEKNSKRWEKEIDKVLN